MASPTSIILTYHSLDASGSVTSIAPRLFCEQMDLLRESGRPVVPLEQARSVPESVALTFDDGYRNFIQFGAPVLAEAGFPATVFVVAGYCGRAAGWPGQSDDMRGLPLMSWSELSELRQSGIALGAHTVNHPDLRTLPDAQVIHELDASRAAVEDRTGIPAVSFAYPYGGCDARVRKLASERFRLACGTRLLPTRSDSDLYNLPRLDVYYLRNLRRFRTVLGGGGRKFLAGRHLLRQARACLSR